MVILWESIMWLWVSVEEGVFFFLMMLFGIYDFCFVKLKFLYYGCMLSLVLLFFKVMKVIDNGGDYLFNFNVLLMLVYFFVNESG